MINENAQALLTKAYLKNGENTWEDLCHRVSHAISLAEETKENQKVYQEIFYEMMQSMDFIPSSPCLMNAGTEQQQLSSCFILDIKDNIESIYGEVKTEMAKIFQKNGGCGFNISALRPANAAVETSKGYSCGPIGFMEEFDMTADIVTRNNQRKGAIKIDMSDFHPDIEEFIKCKDDTTKYTHMNISVSLSDKFMNAVKNNEQWNLRFPDFSECKEIYNKEWNGDIEEWESKNYPVKIYKTINAKDLYYKIMEHAWKTGEPGVSFLDNMNRHNPNPKLGKTTKSNPCFTGDMKLLTDNGYKTFKELCDKDFNIINYKGEISKGKVWCSGTKNIIRLFLSNSKIIECTPNHIFMLEDGTECEAKYLNGKYIKTHGQEKIKVIYLDKNVAKKKVYDFTEPLTHWGVVENCVVHNCAEFVSIPYNSCNLGSINLSNFVKNEKIDYEKLEECVYHSVRFLDNMITVNHLPFEKLEDVTKKVRSVGLGTMGIADMLYKLKIPYNSKEAIELLHDLYGHIQVVANNVSVTLAEEKGNYYYYKDSVFEKTGIPRRNSNLISIAPNGSISFIANTSGGIEPNFALVYTRRTNDNTIYHVVNPVFEDYLKENNIYSESLLQKISDNDGSCQGIDEIPIDMQKVFVTAHDISPNEHLEVLSTVQKYVDLACAKTINLSHNSTVKDIENIYIETWENGIKGVTVYRDGSRENQTLAVKRDALEENIELSETNLKRGMIIQTSDDLISYKKTIINGCGKFYLHSDFDEDTLEQMETFIDVGSGGGCERNYQFISRLISLALRAGVPVEEIIDQGKSIRPCQAYVSRTMKFGDTAKGTSCPSAIAFVLEEMNTKIQENYNFDYELNNEPLIGYIPVENKQIEEEQNKEIYSICEECGENAYIAEGGCGICKNCGASKCM